LRGEVEKLKEEAEKLKAPTIAKNEYGDAVDLYDDAVAAIRKRDADSLEEAEELLDEAKTVFEDAVDTAKRMALWHRNALAEKEQMLSMKARGEENDADTKALVRWQQAESLAREADTYLEAGSIQQALGTYREAKDIYTACLQEVLEDEKFAAAMEKERAAAAEIAKRIASDRGGAGPLPPPPIPPSPGNGGLPPIDPTPPIGPGPSDVGSDVAPIGGTVPCVSAGIAEALPQELDDQDEAFLAENFGKLSQCIAAYDPDTGGILLDYSSGLKLKKELNMDLIRNKKYIDFLTPDMKMAGTTEDIPDEAQISMSGNTKGKVFLPVPFRYRVRVTYELQVGTITGQGVQFGAILNYDPKKKSSYVTNFLDCGMAKSSGAPKWKPKPGKTGPRADKWHPKTRRVPWIVEFTMDEEKGKGLFKTTYDVGLDEEAENGVAMKKPKTRGLVGFQWRSVKFELRKVKVCGILDKEMAVAMLRKKLNMPKEDEPAGDDDDDDDDTGTDDPTVGDDDADREEKKDIDF